MNSRSLSPGHHALMSFLVLSIALPGSWGCALFRDPVPPAFERIALSSSVMRTDADSVAGDLRAHSTLMNMFAGAYAGGLSLGIPGAILGAGAGLGICLSQPFLAPFSPFCALAFGLLGYAVGFAAGVVGGAAYGALTGLPVELVIRINDALWRLEEGTRLEAVLLEALEREIPAEQQVAPREAQARVIARLDEFDLRQHRGDRLSIRLWASLVQQWTDEEGELLENTCHYRYTSETREAEAWLEGGGVPFRLAVVIAVESFARWMSRDLVAFARREELAETDEDPASCFWEPRWYWW